MIDILYLGRIFPKRTAVTAKRELKWSPLLGQLYATMDLCTVQKLIALAVCG